MITGIMVMIIVTPLTAIFQRLGPENKGLLPDGEDSWSEQCEGHAKGNLIQNDLIVDKEWTATEWTLGKAVGTYRFWALCCCNFFLGIGLMTILAHQVRFAVDIGFGGMLAASAFGVYGIANVAGHACGFISDRLGREFTFTLGTTSAILAELALLQVKEPSQLWMLYLHSVLFGLGMGVVAVTIYSGIADIFYGNHLGFITGLAVTILGIGFSIGPWLAGCIYDVIRTYNLVFVMATISISTSCFCFWVASPRKIRLVAGKSTGVK